MDKKKIEAAVKMLLEAIGEDVNREGLVETPARVAKMYEEILSGYEAGDISYKKAVFTDNVYNNFVLVKDIFFSSMCEHHMLPFVGKVHIAYIPKDANLGISKFARIIDLYAHKLQLQERMTEEIVKKIDSTLDNDGIAIFVEAEHMCMTIRGVRRENARTITSKFTKKFLENPSLQQQFFSLIHQGK